MSQRVTDALSEAVAAAGTAVQGARTVALTPRQLHVAVDQCGLLVLHVAGLAEQWQHAASRAHRDFADRGPSTVAALSLDDQAHHGPVAAYRVAGVLAALHHPLGDARRRALGLRRALEYLAGPVHELGHVAQDINLLL